MNDANTLARWIQPHHLDPEVVRSHAERFASTPARMATLEDFLLPDVAERLHRFLRDEAQFAKEYGLYSVDHGVSREEWDQAAEEDRFFTFGKLEGTAPDAQFSPNMLTYLRFRKAFQEDAFRTYFEGLTGMALAASDDFGVHSLTAGDFLKSHDDDNKDRQVALVLYLTPEWRPEFGGALNMIDREGTLTKVDSLFNTIVVFDVRAGTTHHIAPIDRAAGSLARLTIGGWYHRVA